MSLTTDRTNPCLNVIEDDRPEPVFMNDNDYHVWILRGERVGS